MTMQLKGRYAHVFNIDLTLFLQKKNIVCCQNVVRDYEHGQLSTLHVNTNNSYIKFNTRKIIIYM